MKADTDAWSDTRPVVHEFEGGVRSRDRRHGDPFPLPRPYRNSTSRTHDETGANLHSRLLDEAVKAVNGLASASMNSRRALRHDRSPCPSLNPTAVQKAMLDDMGGRLQFFVDHHTPMDEEQALRDMVGGSNLYDQEASALASFDVKKIKIFSRQLTPMDASSLSPPHVVQLLKFHHEFIEKNNFEIAESMKKEPQITPYWDPKLRNNRKARIELYQALQRSGLLCFRRKRKSIISFFTVRKKDNMQRLILDCRVTNRCHREPPKTRLSTPSSFAGIDMTFDTLSERGLGGILGEPAGNEGDVGDCFYNFEVASLSSWFATRDSFSTEELADLGLLPVTIFDDDLGREDLVRAGEVLIPCFSGIPMGWSWALHVANEIIAYQVKQACSGNPISELRDKQEPPELHRGSVITGTYVDNVQVIGATHQDVDYYMNMITSWFEKLGIPFTTAGDDALEEFQTLGMWFDMKHRTIRHRPGRAWRLYYATCALLKRGRVRGETLRIWAGHVVNHFQLLRPALSCLFSTYRFIQASLGRRMMMWTSVRTELRLVKGLCFLGGLDWASEFSRDVYLGDSSTFGYALMVTTATKNEVKEAMKCRERWRFIEAEGGNDPDGVPDASFVKGYTPDCAIGPRTSFGRALQQQQEERHFFRRRARPGKVRNDFLKGPQYVEVPSRCRPLRKEWFEAPRYQLLVARRWKYKHEHINLKEARVCLMGLRRHCRLSSCINTRLLSLSDNMVSVLCFEKGRSKSYSMNQLARRAAAYVIGARLQWILRHVPSHLNVSDAPSRWHDPGVMKAWIGKQKRDRDEMVDNAARSTSPKYVSDIEIPEEDHGTKLPRLHTMASYLPLFVLELFSGSGRLSSCFSTLGMATLDPFEIYHGWEFDLTRPSTQALVLELVRAGMVWYIHAGLPCTVWSRARRNITNLSRARAKEAVAVELTMFCVALFRAQSRLGWYWSVENPKSSRLFEFDPIVGLFGLPWATWTAWDMCMYGQPFKKPTALLSNVPELSALARSCEGGHVHEQLRGTEVYVDNYGKRRYRNKTSAAGEYPLSLCDKWAHVLAKRAPTAAWAPDTTGFAAAFRKRLQEVANCRSGPFRRQEAKNFSDLQPSNHPLHRAQKYSKPIVFGHHTKKEAEWIRRQGSA